MKYLIQVLLEYEDDVVRDIEIGSSKNLYDLHKFIIKIFKLKENEMASFYKINQDFELTNEIPLIDINSDQKTMSKIKISSLLIKKSDQLIYVNNFLKMWRFSVTLISFINEEISNPKCIKKVGEMPSNAPDLEYKSSKQSNKLNENFSTRTNYLDEYDEYNEFSEY